MAEGSWNNVEYAEAQLSDPRANALRVALERALSNGRVLLTRMVATNPDAFDAAARNDLQGLDHLLSSFLRSATDLGGLAELGIASCADLPPTYRAISAFECEGALVHLLISGGAYRGGIPEEVARRLARDFIDASLEGRHLGCTVFGIAGAWSSWFYDVAWDNTFFIYDPHARAWTCLAATDTD